MRPAKSLRPRPAPRHPVSNRIEYFTVRLRRAISQFYLFPEAIALVWSSARGWTIGWILILIARGILPVAQVYLTRQLVDSAVAAIRNHLGYGGLVQPAALIAVSLLAAEALRSASGWVRTAQADLVRNHIGQLVQQKSAEVDLGFYEMPDFYDHLHRAKAEAPTVPLALVENLGGLVQNGITLIAMAGVLMRFGTWLPVLLVVSSVPALIVVLQFAVRQHNWFVRSTEDERRAAYYDHVLTTREYAPEVRLFALTPLFRSRFDAVRARLSTERIKLARGQSLAEFGAGAAALLISGLALVWIAGRALRGAASPGDVALFYQAFQQGSGLTQTLLSNIGQIYRNSLYLEGLFEFLQLQPVITTPPNAVAVPNAITEGISFRNIIFRYPGSERIALDDFSLDVKAGSIVAIVGENGAGKSTLIKLLCRFYDPEAGGVFVDGTDLRLLDLQQLRRAIAVLFQDPAHFHATVAENISPGQSPELAAITGAAHSAGASSVAARLPGGYDNMLGRWFAEGAELSGGEWQRIALARAFLRPSPILILDEPTSAMDPWNEADWLNRFRTLAAGRTTLLVTHRFTTARIADNIAVMAGGRVIEQGTHEELLAAGGRYAEGWAAGSR